MIAEKELKSKQVKSNTIDNTIGVKIPKTVTSLYNKARTLSRLGRIKEAKITVEEAFAAIENRKIYYQDYRKDLEHMKKHIEEHLGA